APAPTAFSFDPPPAPAPAAFSFDPPPPPPPAAPPPSSGDLDFLNLDDAAPPAPMAPPPPMRQADDALEFDPLAPPPRTGGDDLEADLSAPMGGGAQAPAAPAGNDLELLDFIDEAGAGFDKEKGRKVRGGAARFHIRRKSGKTFGPFDQAAVVKMLGEGQLLGNEDVSTDGETWNAIGSVPAFGEAIQKLMESPGGMPALTNLGGEEDKPSTPAESPEQAMERLKAIYGDRMASIAIVDSQGAHRDLRRKLPLVFAGVVLLAILGAGGYLGFTPYGFFGMRWLFPKSLKEGTASWAKFQEASKALQEDTFEGYGKVLAEAEALLRENDSVVESRALFAQAAFYLKRRYSAADDKLPQARRYLDELELSAKDRPEVIKARAGYHLLMGTDAEIRKALETAAAAHPDDPEYNFLLLESFVRERNVEEADKVLQALASLEAKEGKAKALHYTALVRTLDKSPDYNKALELFQKALEANPRHLSSGVEAAALLVQKLDAPDRATDLLRRATSEDARGLLSPTERARAHYLMGIVHAARQEPADAEKQFEEALKVFPDSAPAKAAYGRYLLKKREYE
ncbi:MAG: tetratricopeptide repeat protein, partial [Myxococcales bacterium]